MTRRGPTYPGAFSGTFGYPLGFMRPLLPSLMMALLLLVGCVGAPSAKVTEVLVEEQTDQGTRLVVIVELTNPNQTPLPMPKAHYWVKVGDETFDFQTIPLATLPGQGTQTLQFPAALTAGRSLSGQPYRVWGRISYEPPGDVRRLLVDYRMPLPAVDFSQRGTLR